MQKLRKLSMLRVLAVVGIFAIVLSACTAPATTTAPAAGAPAAEAPAAPATGDLPAEPGRGTDGDLTMLYWQAVSILNPYLSTGTKDFHAASLILEPFFWWDENGAPVLALASEWPTIENGGVSADQTTITWKLQEGITFSDGSPLSADDAVFTWEYCTNPETPCSSTSPFNGVTSVEAVDPLTVKVTFDGPKPFPYGPFGGMLSPVLQKAQFADCTGARAQECGDQNTAPIGTGPYIVTEFRANDTVVYGINELYRVADQPHFATITIKGGGDAAAAARAVLETGEVDWGWNLQVEPAVLNPMAEAGIGTVYASRGGSVERILMNFTNPDPALGEDRSEWKADGSTAHPFLSDINVRQAMSLAIDRTIIAEQLYGFAGDPTCNILSGPPAVVSDENDGCLVQDIDGAKALLEGAGWVDSNGDGVREKDGVELRVLYQTSTNAVRQKAQALVQQWWQEIGIATELKNIDAGVFFGGDPASPDTLGKFYADVQMFTNNPDSTDPQNYLAGWRCGTDGENIAKSSNNYLANNTERWCSEEYDALFETFAATTDPAERQALAKQLNDLLAQNYVNLPLVFRGDVSAGVNSLTGIRMNSWDSQLWNIGEWQRVR